MTDKRGVTDKRSVPLDAARFRVFFLLLLVVGVTLLFGHMVRPFLMALLLAAIFSGVLYPVHERISKAFRGRTTVAAMCTLLAFAILLIAPTVAFLGVVMGQAVHVTQAAGPAISAFQEQLRQPGALDRLLEGIPFMDQIRPWEGQIVQKAGELAAGLGGFVVRGIGDLSAATMRLAVLAFVTPYAMFYFLTKGPKLLDTVLHYIPLSDADERRLLTRFVSVTRAMVKGTFLIGILQGALAGLAFMAVGIPSAAFWGTVMAVLCIVPVLGSALVWIPASIYLLVTGETVAGVGLILWCGLVVGTMDNFLRPFLVGRDTEMPDLMILLGTLGGLGVFGVAGIIIGPIVAAVFITVWELYGESFGDLLPAPASGPTTEVEFSPAGGAESGSDGGGRPEPDMSTAEADSREE